jgi:hypothetical protein
MQRRRILLAAVGLGGTTLLSCGGSGSADGALAPPPVAQPQIVWDVTPWMVFIAGQSTSVDLGVTLPPEFARGGSFSLAAGSAPLPPGFALSPGGRLTVSNPQLGQTPNVVFMYVEPGG